MTTFASERCHLLELVGRIQYDAESRRTLPRNTQYTVPVYARTSGNE